MNNYHVNTRKSWLQTKSDLAELFAKWNVAPRNWLAECQNPKVANTYSVDPLLRRASVRFIHPNGREVYLMLDAQPSAAANLRAIFLTLEDYRMVERRGLAELMQEVAAQLVALPDPHDPYHVLGIERGATLDRAEAAYRVAALREHPDHHAGDDTQMRRVNAAIAAIRAEHEKGAQHDH